MFDVPSKAISEEEKCNFWYYGLVKKVGMYKSCTQHRHFQKRTIKKKLSLPYEKIENYCNPKSFQDTFSNPDKRFEQFVMDLKVGYDITLVDEMIRDHTAFEIKSLDK